ncbi:MAG: hypothetical protein M1820_006448 [Bogoriella megaspora]|nr:MAG: hypothetical protein M1820_006448 [Bogoriella megaspora]
MGRRKIEIKAIKDDRNRSVTFLKRKGGLFKKAHELSVLCSVDVAVIIFGHNKKLYEFSSGDINETLGRYQYYGGAHEHKGPEDFMGKRDGDDEDEDDENVGSPPGESRSPPDHPNVPYGLTSHPGYQHMRQHTASASPPMPNGSIPFHQRQGTPQPHPGSRPSSRNAFRRTSSNLVPQHPGSQGPPGPNSYAYVPNPPIYQPAPATAPMQMNRPSQPPHQPQYQYTHPPPQQGPVHQAYMQDQRRQSMPPAFPQQHQQHQQHPQDRPAQVHQPSPPQPEQNDFQSPPLPQQQPPQQQQPPPQQQQQPPQPKPLSQAAKSHSIFTPIDDSRSLLAQHWGNTSNTESNRSDPVVKVEGPRSQSIDVAVMQRNQMNGTPNQVGQPRPPPPIEPPQRTNSSSSIAPISRTNSVPDAKRPRLTVQIPSEQSDGGEATADSSPKESTTGQTPARPEGHGGVVLPPPSPSASAIMSAGAQGPPNPFARPAPPMSSYNTNGNNKDIETPLSALPSRFVDNGLLPSPSSFYPPDWGFGRGDGNILPSPLNFQTPVATNGPSFRDEDERKRKTSEGSDGGASKRIKT